MSYSEFGDASGVRAHQQNLSGQVVTGRSRYRKLFIQHVGSGDETVKFYDLASAPTGGEPYYSFICFAKGSFTLEMPDEGVIFHNGIYVEIPAGSDMLVTSFYEGF